MDMQDQLNSTKPFYICQHDIRRTRVTADLLYKAQAGNGTVQQSFDTLSTPITTDAFHARVDTLVAEFVYGRDSFRHRVQAAPNVAALTFHDTFLAPEKFTSQLLGFVSTWIDICSSDPVVYNVSRQVLRMEVAYASFCGLNAIVLPAPLSSSETGSTHGISQYANAIKEILESHPYINFSVNMHMMAAPSESPPSNNNLGHLARPEFAEPANIARSPSKASGQSRGIVGTVASGDRGSLDPDDSRSSLDSVRKNIRIHDFLGTWDVWNAIRTLCNYNARLFVALKIPRYLPPSSICFRWYSEPLRILALDASTFFANVSGYPVLTANHRALINLYMKTASPPCILLEDAGSTTPDIENPDVLTDDERLSNPSLDTSAAFAGAPTPSEAQANVSRRRATKTPGRDDPLAHLKYLRWFQTRQPNKTYIEIQSTGYQDYLQAPLQPLTDNLESMTYEVFEQDPVKYRLYEQAIRNALNDWRQRGLPTSGYGSRVVLAVVGAGRGPLVTQALNAGASTGVPIEVWALEKNQNAFVVLERKNASAWQNQVHLVQSDMRQWKGPVRVVDESKVRAVDGNHAGELHETYPIDIIVSELLGSFGDNELSPECLDSALHLLNPTHGISIPESYTALLTPIATPKLYADVSGFGAHDNNAFNTASVVCLQKFDYLSTKPHSSVKGPDMVASPTISAHETPSQEYAASREDDDNGQFVTKSPQPIVHCAWSFHHGPSSPLNPSTANTHNIRHARLSFDLRHRGVCHGLAGYFEAVLYPGVELSTNPLNKDEKSPDMMSWFPIFFPLKTPLYTSDYSTLVASMFRATDNRKVWYEWMVEAWSNNPGTKGGTGCRLGVSEMMSSKEKGCLM